MKKIFVLSYPFLFIFFIWFLFSYPYFLKGRIPYSATYQNNNFAPWDAYPNLSGPVKNGAMPDVTTQIIPWKHFTIETYKKGQIPLWNPNSFSGTPHVANYQSAVLSPFNLLFFIFPFFDAWSLLILLQPLLAGIFMYLFIRSLQVSKLGSLLSSISFMFCGFIVVWLDYGTLAYAILFLPLALFAIEKFNGTGNSLYLCLLSLTIPLSFFSGHFQISIYFFLTIIIWIIYKHFQTRKPLNTIYYSLYTLLGLLSSLAQILPSMEFYNQSLRSDIFQKGEVIPWAYMPTFLAPDFFGNPVTRNDWFGHYAEWNGYIGLFPLIVSFYALKKRNFQIYFLFIFALISVFLAFPTPILDIVINLHVPVLATSAVSRIIVLSSFLFITLAGIGFDTLMEDMKKKNIKPIFIWVFSFVAVFLFLWVTIVLKLFIPKEKIFIAKQNFILPSIEFIITIGIIVLGLLSKKKVYVSSIGIIGFALILITSFDMLRFATKWQAFDPKQLAFNAVGVTKFFPGISGFERVIGNFGAEAATYYNLPSMEGYDALYIKRYGEFIASLSTGNIQEAYRSVVIFPRDSTYTAKAMNLLNVGYIVHKVSDDQRGWTFPYWKYPVNQFQKLYDDGAYRIYKNIVAFPRTFLISNYFIKTNPQDIFSTMFSDNVNLRNTVILEKNPGISSKKSNNTGSATITKYTPDIISVFVHANSNELLFLSDPFYSGWKAFVDGKETEILRADYAFRAIKISPGEHTVKFIYQPISFLIGIYAAIVSICSIIGITFFLKLSPLRKVNS